MIAQRDIYWGLYIGLEKRILRGIDFSFWFVVFLTLKLRASAKSLHLLAFRGPNLCQQL